MLKVLFISHDHADIRPGGAEIISFELFQGVRSSGEFEAVYLARCGPPLHVSRPGTPFQSINNDPAQILFYSDQFDEFYMSQRQPGLLSLHFQELLRTLQPDVVHFHHTFLLGVELIRQVRNTLPKAAIVYTLHEYFPICAARGKMLRLDGRGLCEKASPAQCHQCIPSRSPSEFFMRERFLKSHFELVDMFIAPSAFLLQRFVEWGIPEGKIVSIENGRLPQPERPSREVEDAEGSRGRMVFLGQLRPEKGLLVLLRAMKILSDKRVAEVHLELNGANLSYESDSFQREFHGLVQACRRNVTLRGEYRPVDIPELLADADWVVVPSIWWENSPLVIQEAFMQRRPVICSGIGGMAEKVSDGIDGLHFRASDAEDLARTMARAARTPGLWQRLRNNIRPVFSISQSVDAHESLYRLLIARRKADDLAVHFAAGTTS